MCWRFRNVSDFFGKQFEGISYVLGCSAIQAGRLSFQRADCPDKVVCRQHWQAVHSISFIRIRETFISSHQVFCFQGWYRGRHSWSAANRMVCEGRRHGQKLSKSFTLWLDMWQKIRSKRWTTSVPWRVIRHMSSFRLCMSLSSDLRRRLWSWRVPTLGRWWKYITRPLEIGIRWSPL